MYEHNKKNIISDFEVGTLLNFFNILTGSKNNVSSVNKQGRANNVVTQREDKIKERTINLYNSLIKTTICLRNSNT